MDAGNHEWVWCVGQVDDVLPAPEAITAEIDWLDPAAGIAVEHIQSAEARGQPLLLAGQAVMEA